MPSFSKSRELIQLSITQTFIIRGIFTFSWNNFQLTQEIIFLQDEQVSRQNQLPAGLLAQLAGQCTGTAKAMGSTPTQALSF